MRRFWTEAERERLMNLYPDTPTPEVARLLGRTVHAVYNQVDKLGLTKSAAYLAGPHAIRFRRPNPNGEACQFQPGHTPWNTGLKGYDPGVRSGETCFQPGNRPQSWQPIGTEVLDPKGYRKRKVSDGGHPARRDWQYVHVLLWEQTHGLVPRGHVVIFIDGDKTHLSIDNLACVSRAELAYLNNHGYADLSGELRPSAMALARLVCKRHDIVRRSRGG